MSMPGLPAPQRPVAISRSRSPRIVKAFLAGSLALVLAACGGGGGKLGTMDPNDIPRPPPAPEDLYQIGTGAGAGFQAGIIYASHTTLRAGETSLLRVNIVDSNGQPVNSTPTISSACIATGLATVSDVTEVTTGLFSATYVNNSCAGTDTVTATLPNENTATVVLDVSAAQALTLSHVSTVESQLVLGGIGGTETTEVLFNLAGPQGVPIVGKVVSFSISSSAGEATILPDWETNITDQEGNVRTIIKSGTVAGPVTVIATDNETGVQGHSEDIIISTGVVTSQRFSLSYGPWNPANAFNTDGITVNINVRATDMFGNPPVDGTRVSFVAPYNGGVTDHCTLADGGCSVTWTSQGPRSQFGFRSYVLAYMDGAESFVDMNGNSVFDAGDNNNFQDLPEPFADLNENGTHDPSEFFFDVNKNGIWDTNNGVWDGPCLNALNAAALCPGSKTISIFETVTIVMPTNTVQILDRGNFPPAGDVILINSGGSRTLVDLILGDNYSNPLPNGTTVEFAIEGAGVSLQGLTNTTIGNTLWADSYLFGITLAADVVPPPEPADPALCPGGATPATPPPNDCFAIPPSNVRLLMIVTLPEADTAVSFSWPIDVSTI